ncbi:prolyl oligopeptidase family serine peptidase [Asticcacaulis sp. BYS171W]|uniref:Prolyl oligopeptidase family serine peptidase n=1 Tax=Asticcacaulis aquaticus TaxID=2984212 RepID=A0ABT5HUA6_9CAUL|nr:prolyl oligopeptidase family serine peptidase [Asticcacaulis aquaticus]MDC7683559.1 prolyl oligopeptidase family serine peptidase [Asticcacaulis aquaticus]
MLSSFSRRALTAAASLLILGALPLSTQAQMTNITTTAKQTPTNPNIAKADVADPRQYLEEVEGEKALAWVKAQNERSLAHLTADPRFAQNQADMLKIVEATDRIPSPSFSKGGHVDNFWQDKDHVRGIWRRMKKVMYLGGSNSWDTILDFDALAKAEGKNWVYKGASCLPPEETRCLINLSNGGKDAVTVREFDVKTKTFVEGGFSLPEGKQVVTWKDADTLYVAREWTPGEVTPSGYAFVTKALKRGQTLDQAVEIHRGDKSDMMAYRTVIRDVAGRYVIDIAERRPTFFEVDTTYYTDKGEVKLPLPLTSEMNAYYKGQAVFSLKDSWTSAKGTVFKEGSVIAFDLFAALKDPKNLEPVVVFAPNDHQSVQGMGQTKNRLVLQVLSNVTGQVMVVNYEGGKWSLTPLRLPENSTLSLGSLDDETDELFVWSSGYLQPSSLYLADAGWGTVTNLKASPQRFNAEGLKVEQHWATSKDGTKIPYFLVMKKDTKLDGNTPTLLYAYGGFEVSLTPSYSGGIGKLWLEKGGAYVLANIRGGGEFGPKWHEAGLKTHRQVIYDDFQAVAEDLIRTKVTSPRRLGIMGGSNGGLLMGVQLTQRPDLWNAVVVQVPLLDMMRFHTLLAGASWQGEYGRPDDATEGAFLKTISPYHNLKAGVKYPEPFFVTSTKDDRVHPGHARKMAALMEDMGLPFLYYENTDGGHSAAANLKETAKRNALEYTYLAQKLMD